MRSCKLGIVIAADGARGDRPGVRLAKLFAHYAADRLALRAQRGAAERAGCFLASINRFVFVIVCSGRGVAATLRFRLVANAIARGRSSRRSRVKKRNSIFPE